MPKEKIAFIINPVSGRRNKWNKIETIGKYLDNKKFKPFFYTTEFRGHARELAKQAAEKGCVTLVAVGGDGTVNEVAGVAAERKLTLAIIPAGSGNGLARHLKIPLDAANAVRLINEGKKISMDAGKMNNIWFFCTCGIGFDAKIGRKFSKTKVRGFGSYVKTVVREFRRYNSRKYKFFVDEKKIVRRAFLITIANASQYGNNAVIAPQAEIDDGLFDVCILKPFPVIKVLGLAIMLFRRSIDESNYYEMLQGKKIVFKKRKSKYIMHYDGEPVKIKKGKIRIRMYRKILEVIVPSKG
jgi:YegS/Rv2252/BmrU family lipid kinase